MIDMCEIEEMRERGLSYMQISNSIGIPANTVCYYCHQHGIVGPNDFAKASKKYPPEIDAMILRLRDEGLSYVKIGKRLKMPKTSVQNRLRTIARHELLKEVA